MSDHEQFQALMQRAPGNSCKACLRSWRADVYACAATLTHTFPEVFISMCFQAQAAR